MFVTLSENCTASVRGCLGSSGPPRAGPGAGHGASRYDTGSTAPCAHRARVRVIVPRRTIHGHTPSHAALHTRHTAARPPARPGAARCATTFRRGTPLPALDGY